MKLGTYLSTVTAALLLTGAPAYAAEYEVDPSHSTIGFKVRHLGISSVFGQFGDVTASFFYDPAKIETAKAEAKIGIKSVNTQQSKRDDHLRNADFFDAEKYPYMTYTTTKVERTSKDTFRATGDLTIRGVTKPVTLDITEGGTVKDPMGKERAAFTATTKVNRKDFGLAWSKVLETGALVVGDEVTITLEIEGIKKGGAATKAT